MNQATAQQQLDVIRAMVDRSRRETAESGHFFIWIGVLSTLGVFVIRMLEVTGRGAAIIPTLAALTVGNGILAYVAIVRGRRNAGARSYASRVCYSVWLACGIAAILAALLLPLLGAVPWNLVPVLVALIIGVGVFSTGVILESGSLLWGSLAWWASAIAMAMIRGGDRAYIMAAAIVLGWILPGVALNRTYRRQRDDHDR